MNYVLLWGKVCVKYCFNRFIISVPIDMSEQLVYLYRTNTNSIISY